jgi:hypothetical protein
MRYAAFLAASAAFVAVFTLPRDGRSESAPAARLAAPAAGSLAAQAIPAGRRSTQEDFRWSGRIAQGDQIEIRGLLGNVHAEPASGDQVEVVGRRMGSDADQVRIEVVETDEGVVICTVYPRRERASRRGDDGERRSSRGRADAACNDGQSGELELDSDEARIEFTVRVPAGVRFAARTVEGNIRAEGLRGAVDAASVAGNVRVSTTGTARAATVSGNVDASFGQTDGGEMEFASVSGNVVVRLAGGVGARVEAHTLSGDIQSDFDLRMAGEDDDDDDGGRFHVRIGQQATGTIGGGGPELTLNTVSGNIRLLRNR